MKKIPTIFKRDLAKHILINEPHLDCDWVFNGEGTPTRKYDGTCCLIKDEKLYKRREVKKGKQIPDGFIKVDFDETTGKTVGWLLVTSEDKWHLEGFENLSEKIDGTYELLGPKVQGNPEVWKTHFLLPHKDAMRLGFVPTKFEDLKDWISFINIEGIVWHHPDGKMAKIKKKDFGLKR